MLEDAVQGGTPPPAPIGVVYNTAMQRPDAALALGALHVLISRRQARLGAVCVVGAGLDTAIFCDVVGRFYVPGQRSGNQALAVGLADVRPMPPDSPMVRFAVQRTKEDGEPYYLRGITTLGDTSHAEAVLRNGITFSVESSVLLSAPATSLARSLSLSGTKDQYRQRVKRVVIVESPELVSDAAALRQLVSDCPVPLFFVGKDVGEALRFPGARLDEAFGWTPAHPVADAYRMFRSMPYDAPLHDLAAMHFLVQPDSGFFAVSDPGTLSVAARGAVTFTPSPAGTIRRITVDSAKREAVLDTLIDVATSAPVAPQGRGGRGA